MNCRGARSKRSPIEIPEYTGRSIEDDPRSVVSAGLFHGHPCVRRDLTGVVFSRSNRTDERSFVISIILELLLGECPNTTKLVMTAALIPKRVTAAANVCQPAASPRADRSFERRSEFNAVLDPYQIADTRRDPFSKHTRVQSTTVKPRP